MVKMISTIFSTAWRKLLILKAEKSMELPLLGSGRIALLRFESPLLNMSVR